MKCIALKISKSKNRYITIMLGIIVIIVGLHSIVNYTWYDTILCSVVGGGYIIWLKIWHCIQRLCPDQRRLQCF